MARIKIEGTTAVYHCILRVVVGQRLLDLIRGVELAAVGTGGKPTEVSRARHAAMNRCRKEICALS